MEWVNNRRYSFNSIVRALNNKKEKIKDNEKFQVFLPPSFENALLIGGGINAVHHVDGIKEFIKNKDFVIIHATARNALSYLDVDVPQYFCLVGSEGERLEQVFKNTSFNAICLLPPFPRLMGTYVPIHIKAKTFELYSIDFTDLYLDSCTTLALQTALSMNVKNVFAVGYDGYMDGLISSKERELSIENTFLFDSYSKYCGNKIISLTPTLYSNLTTMSVYQEL
jgi:4-hydroxy 2-oxovalerate aldolase